MSDIIKKACEKAGGISALARAIGIKHTTIYSWTLIPAERVIDVAAATGMSREELRPDLYAGMTTIQPAPEQAQ